MAITEIGLMGVKPSHPIMDPNHPSGAILSKIYETIASAPGGPSKLYYGLEIENPLNLWACFDWPSLEAHQEFAKSFGGEAVKDLPLILTHGEFTKHVNLTPFPPIALEAPVTAVLLAYFPSDISNAAKDAAAAQLMGFLDMVKDAESVKGVTSGWGTENDFPVRGEEGVVGSVLMAFVGWEGVEAHEKVREMEEYKGALGAVRGMEGLLKLVQFHVKCQVVEKQGAEAHEPVATC